MVENIEELRGGLLYLNFPCFDFGKIQDVVDHGQQMVPCFLNRFDSLFSFACRVGKLEIISEKVCVTQNRCQRRADFVTHVSQEFTFTMRSCQRGFLCQPEFGDVIPNREIPGCLPIAILHGSNRGIQPVQLSIFTTVADLTLPHPLRRNGFEHVMPEFFRMEP